MDVVNVVNTAVNGLDDDLFDDFDENAVIDDDEKERAELEAQSLLLAMSDSVVPDLISGEDVEEIDTSWLWEGYLGAHPTVITGESGTMKTYLTCAIASWFTGVGKFPDGTEAPQFPVIFCNAEDSMGAIRKRVRMSGGKPENIKFLNSVRVNDATNIRVVGKQPFQLPRDMPVLAKAIQAVSAGLVIIDPIGGTVKNANNDSFVREHVMTPLTAMCEKLDVCVIFINHTNDGQYNENNFLRKFKHAKAFHEAARMSVLIMPEPGSDGVSVWKQVKNSTHKRMPQLRYYLEETPLSGGPYVRFLDNVSADERRIAPTTSVNLEIKALIYREGEGEIGVTQTRIVQALSNNYPASTVKMALRRMVEARKLEQRVRGEYNLPPNLRRRSV